MILRRKILSRYLFAEFQTRIGFQSPTDKALIFFQCKCAGTVHQETLIFQQLHSLKQNICKCCRSQDIVATYTSYTGRWLVDPPPLRLGPPQSSPSRLKQLFSMFKCQLDWRHQRVHPRLLSPNCVKLWQRPLYTLNQQVSFFLVVTT